MRKSRALVAAALLTTLLAGCGGDPIPEEPATSAAVPPSTPSEASAEPAGPSSAAEALSEFEDSPQVVVMRKFARAVMQDVNAGDPRLPRAGEFLNRQGKDVVPGVFGAEFDKAYRYPGPMPLTPISIKPDGDVVACVWLTGWRVDPATGKSDEEKAVGPVLFDMEFADDTWRIAHIVTTTADCRGVEVQGVRQ